MYLVSNLQHLAASDSGLVAPPLNIALYLCRVTVAGQDLLKVRIGQHVLRYKLVTFVHLFQLLKS